MKKNENAAVELPGIDENQLAIWKNKHGKIFSIEIESDNGPVTAWFRKPDLQVVSAASKFAESDPVKSGVIMFESCWLGGDEVIKTDDELKLSAINVLGTVFKVREAKIKNWKALPFFLPTLLAKH